MKDAIVDEVRRVRDELIERYGGIEGYFKHCQAQEKRRAAPARPRRPRSRQRTRRKAMKAK